MSTRKRLTIHWLELSIAFENDSYEIGIESPSYFDPETGQVIHPMDDDLELDEESDVEIDDRCIEIPTIDSAQAYRFMEDFVDEVPDAAIQGRLREALSQRKPFHRFQETIADDRRLQHQWRSYETNREHQLMIEWLESIGIEPENAPEIHLPELPELRKIMLAEVNRFVEAASRIKGVERIALIGSLTTKKEFPQDIDLLVTVADDAELNGLAKLGRQVRGRMQSHSAGADIFLIDPTGTYLGRTCGWKRCGPGNRASCDALHCGARKYLHDDLDSIHLSKQVTAKPPVLLWPEIAIADGTPDDVRSELCTQSELF